MKVLKIMVLEKLHSKFGNNEVFIWDIKNFLKVAVRIPKELCSILISELINEGSLIKTGNSRYKLKDKIIEEAEKEKKKLNIIRNRVFI